MEPSQKPSLAEFFNMVPPTASCTSNRTAGGAEQPHRRPLVQVSTHHSTYERYNRLFRRLNPWYLFPDSQPPDHRAMNSGFCALNSPSFKAQVAPEKRQQSNVSRRKSPVVYSQPVVFSQCAGNDLLDDRDQLRDRHQLDNCSRHNWLLNRSVLAERNALYERQMLYKR